MCGAAKYLTGGYLVMRRGVPIARSVRRYLLLDRGSQSDTVVSRAEAAG